MNRILEEAIPYTLQGLDGLCSKMNLSRISYSKYKGSQWWLTPIILLNVARMNPSVRSQLTGSHLRSTNVDVDGYSVPAIEVILNGVNSFVFMAKDYPALKGHYLTFKDFSKYEEVR